MEPFGILLLAIAAIVVLRLLAGALDGSRIEEYLRARGGRLLARTWTPFGKGWFGERSDRIYAIEYEDRDGERHRATVKTSLFTGVYLTDDQVVRRGHGAEKPPRAEVQPPAADEVAALRRENDRLRARLARRDRS